MSGLLLRGLGFAGLPFDGVDNPSWDPFERGASLTPSGSDLVMTNGNTSGSWTSAKSWPPQSTGKWYAEIVATTVASATFQIFGFCDASPFMQTFLGGMAKSIGFRAGGSSVFVQGAGISSSWTTSYTIAQGDTVNLAMDIDAGRVWIGKNGTWLGGGDPAAGTNPAGLISAGSWSFGFTTFPAGASVYTLRPTNVIHTIPSGFSLLPTAPRRRLYVAVDGDSITAGTSGPTTPYAQTALTGIARFRNYAAGGQQISAMENTAQNAYKWYALNRADKRSVVTIMGGRNDIAVGGRTAAQVITSLQNYGAARKAEGHHVVMCTILPDSSVPGFNTTRATVNTAMRTWGGVNWDSLVDYDTTIMGQDSSAPNGLYYFDGTHPTQLGQDLLSVLYKEVIQAIP